MNWFHKFAILSMILTIWGVFMSPIVTGGFELGWNIFAVGACVSFTFVLLSFLTINSSGQD